MTNLSIDNSINKLFEDLSYSQNNLEVTNLNIMEILSSLTIINNKITDLDSINSLLNTIGKKILNKFVLDGSNSVVKIIKNCQNLTVNVNTEIDNDNFYLTFKNSLNEETFKLIDETNNTTNYIIFLLDLSHSIVTFQSINSSGLDTSINIQNSDNFDLEEILSKNVNYLEINSTNTQYKLVLVNKKVL